VARSLISYLSSLAFLSKVRGARLTSEEAFSASALGWCVEWLQAFFLVADDKMDSSVTRRGKPCWYRVAGVGNTAINDSFILESQIYRIVRRYFKRQSPRVYAAVLELLHETTMQTEVGQLLDLTTQPIEGPVDLGLFTLARYKSIVKYKTAFYTFYLPMALGLVHQGVDDEETLDATREICLQMGEYFQIQDDYLDAYGAPEVIGKIGTDIQDKKCSWLVVQAMSRANPAQLAAIRENYGVDDEEKIALIKGIYRDLDLESVFKAYEEESYARLSAMIDEFQGGDRVPKEVFRQMLEKIYKRKV
jgi:farnesyl diphosphate synthase